MENLQYIGNKVNNEVINIVGNEVSNEVINLFTIRIRKQTDI